MDLIVDGGSQPTQVSWVREDGGCARVEPERFSVVGRRFAVRVLIEPSRAGRLRETLRFRAVDRDGVTAETAAYVRGTVDAEPAVLVRSGAISPTVAVCAGWPESYAVGLRLTPAVSPFRVLRRLYEFDFGGGNGGGTWSLSDLGATSYGPYETAGSCTATLTFQTPVDTEVIAILIVRRRRWARHRTVDRASGFPVRNPPQNSLPTASSSRIV